MFKKRIIYSCTLCLQDLSKSPKNMKKLLPKRKPERKPSEEDFTTRKSNRGAKLSPSPSTGLHGLTCGFPLAGTAALEEDAQILKVIEAYCTSAKTRQTLNSSESKRNIIHMHRGCVPIQGARVLQSVRPSFSEDPVQKDHHI